jgi:DNA-binding NarL/FixJ family response regulator
MSEQLAVVVVDDHWITGQGAADVLRNDPGGRFLVTAVVSRIADLAPAVTGAQYDVCVLDLVGVGSAGQVERMLKTRPSVVCTASEDWRVRVAAWSLGARAVLGKDVHGPPLAEAVWDAVHVPYDVKPQLAQALLDAVEASLLPLSVRQRAILADLASGVPRGQVIQDAGLTTAEFMQEVVRIRHRCTQAGLDRLSLPASALPDAADAPAADELSVLSSRLTAREREILELYADGSTDADIARLLGIQPLTVRNHMVQALLRCDIHQSDRETRLWFALAMTGRHRFPDRIGRRITALRGRGADKA